MWEEEEMLPFPGGGVNELQSPDSAGSIFQESGKTASADRCAGSSPPWYACNTSPQSRACNTPRSGLCGPPEQLISNLEDSGCKSIYVYPAGTAPQAKSNWKAS